MNINVINPQLDATALKNQAKCHCCKRPAIKNKGRVFFMGYWICHDCEDHCTPDLSCNLT